METTHWIKDNPYLITSIVAIALFIIGRRYFIKNRTTDDQKTAIFDLVEDIHNSKFSLQFGNHKILANGTQAGSSSGNENLTLFKIRRYSELEERSEFEDTPVYFEIGSSFIIDTNKHILNPRMPRKIKNILKKFQNSHLSTFPKNPPSQEFDFVMIESGKLSELPPMFQPNMDTRFKHGNSIAYKSYLSFITCCKELEKNIAKWAKKNKIELNIENDFEPE